MEFDVLRFTVGLHLILSSTFAQTIPGNSAVSFGPDGVANDSLPQEQPEAVVIPNQSSNISDVIKESFNDSTISIKQLENATATATDLLEKLGDDVMNSTGIVQSNGNNTNEAKLTPKMVTGKTINASAEMVNKFSDQLRIILKHFQQPDKVPLPGDKIIPDPMDVPDMSGNFGFQGNFTNITVHDQSKFTIESINTNLDEMQLYVSLRMKRLMILGNYSISSLFGDTDEGPFNVTLIDALAEGTVYLAKNEDGRIYANRSVTNMMYENINAQFINTSSWVVNLAASFLFIGIKPYVLNKVDEKLCNDMNVRLSTVTFRLPKEPWSPVDLAVREGTKYVKKNGYDPLVIDNVFKYDEQFIAVRIDRLTLNGLSRFTRVGNVTLSMEKNNIQMGVRIMTGKIEGNVEWFYDFGKIGMNRNGSSTFGISRLQIYAIVNQPVDIRNKPVLQSLDIEIGPVSVKMDGEGSFDYMVEFVVMLLPKMVRHMIIDSLEIPIRNKVQEMLNHVDVEKLVDDNLDDVDYYVNHFKLNDPLLS